MKSPAMPFTAHNIVLGDGTLTRPNSPVTADEPVTRAVMRSLDLFFPPSERKGKTIVDLGCLEGGYTVEFARAGFEATGMEAREQNVERCDFVASQLALPNLHFVRDDVRNLGNYAPFDAIFCSGLLYHLDRPATYLRLLAQQANHLLILHTHYGLPTKIPSLIKSGVWAMAHEARTDYTMLLACLFFLIVGAGRWSVDAHLAGVADPPRVGERPAHVA